MKGVLFNILLVAAMILHAGKPDVSIKSLYEEGGVTMLNLVVSNVPRAGSIDHISERILSYSNFNLLKSEFVHSKRTGEFYIISKKSVNIDEIETLIQSMGFRELSYNGKIIRIEDLSDQYQPVIPVEFINKSRN